MATRTSPDETRRLFRVPQRHRRLDRNREKCRKAFSYNTQPGWRNGRRGGLKSRYLSGCAGSTPAPGTLSSCGPTGRLWFQPGRRALMCAHGRRPLVVRPPHGHPDPAAIEGQGTPEQRRSTSSRPSGEPRTAQPPNKRSPARSTLHRTNVKYILKDRSYPKWLRRFSLSLSKYLTILRQAWPGSRSQRTRDSRGLHHRSPPAARSIRS